MNAETEDVVWLDARRTLTQEELAQLCRLPVAEVEELVDYGLLVPEAGPSSARRFSAACVQPLRQAGALRAHFDLDVFVLGLIYAQFERISRLEQQLRSVQAHLPHAGAGRDGPAPWQEPHDCSVRRLP